MKWTRRAHPLARLIPKLKEHGITFPRWQYVGTEDDGRFSIISPSSVSYGLYELMDFRTGDVMRLKTLGEAKAKAESINKH